MVATRQSFLWFKPEGADEWHVFGSDSPLALCEEVSIRHNRDEIADATPSGAVKHEKCVEALKAKEQQ